MKKFTFYGKVVASLAIALGLVVALAVFLPSCDKDEGSDDGDLYKPSENMTVEEIRTLFEEVDANMASVRKVSATVMRGIPSKLILVATAQVDRDGKKDVSIEYDETDGKTIESFRYIENTTAYVYEVYDNGKEEKERYKVSDAYWNRTSDMSELVDLLDLEWEVENSAFVGSYSEGSSTTKMTITITSSKLIGSIKTEHVYQGSTSMYEYTYTYSANPALPSGFNLSEFPPATQYSVEVEWGEEQGKSTFYTQPRQSYLYASEVLDYAPKVQGKKPEGLYKDQAFKQKITSPISLSDNNTVLYVKWVDDSGSTSKSKSKPAAKSLLKRLSRNLEGAEAQ
jgi:hypothetical protein